MSEAGTSGESDLVRVGRVGKPHGVRGGFYVEGAIAVDPISPGSTITIAARQFKVTNRAGTDARPILAVEGIDDRDQAASLRGETVWSPREAVPLDDDEWLATDLEGMKVVTADGTVIGTVERLTNLPSVDILEVPRAHADDMMLPMVSGAIIEIDASARVITIDAEFLGLGSES
ncbi:MAG TPA: ribosome maturation factor RimM [Solirubrobacterales bacterium]|jgi:16S rRNA processing protein RimM|nr:ribosome maturation factor RimM [Solirubrobacterales bacterium]